jgi:hypothetical protein
VGASNGAHILGTLVLGEEPSTASKADLAVSFGSPSYLLPNALKANFDLGENPFFPILLGFPRPDGLVVLRLL